MSDNDQDFPEIEQTGDESEMPSDGMRCGFVAIVGRPNVGKSTLLNHILGQKLSITSRKPQTTRHQILGIKTEDDVQVVYVDTPGLHLKEVKAINRYMNKAASDALKGVDKPVLVKNPVNPDLPLWLGAVERFKTAGISQLGVIHRGFSTYNSLHYRNKPKWHLAIELKKEFPSLPLILDPSHICGRRDTLLDVSQTGLDLNYDGFMIETHIDPDNAWSDAAQQVTPAQLSQITDDLKIRQKSSTKEEFQRKLTMHRKELDLIDGSIIDILGDRMGIAKEIGKLKHSENVAILQSSRWSNMLSKMVEDGKEKGLSKDFIEEVFRAIHVESINIQHKV